LRRADGHEPKDNEALELAASAGIAACLDLDQLIGPDDVDHEAVDGGPISLLATCCA
jgi:hypothetical protein